MINGFVKGQELKIKQPLIVADTLDYITARFIFRSPDWNGCSKWVHFKQGETVWDIHLVNDKVTEDKHLNLTEGEWEVYIHGTKGNTRITTEVVKVIVQRSGALNGEPPIEVPPDVAEQLDSRIKALETGGGGGEGGTTDYNFLTNQPKINGVILKGDKTAEELGLQPKGEYLTNESDPTVPAWAKEPQKPTYTAKEVGAVTKGELDEAVKDKADKADIPTKTSQLKNDSDFATNASVDKKIANIPEGSKDYNDLTNHPKINDVELKGNLTTEQLGIAEIPKPTAEDNGKFLRVDNLGKYALETIPTAEGAEF